MSDTVTKTRQQAFMDVLFHALRVTDASLNKNAAFLLTQMGSDPVRRLVLGAAHRKNRVPHRLRMLTVIERIGRLSCADDFMLMTILAADPDEHIRAAAGRCLATCPISEA